MSEEHWTFEDELDFIDNITLNKLPGYFRGLLGRHYNVSGERLSTEDRNKLIKQVYARFAAGE